MAELAKVLGKQWSNHNVSMLFNLPWVNTTDL